MLSRRGFLRRSIALGAGGLVCSTARAQALRGSVVDGAATLRAAAAARGILYGSAVASAEFAETDFAEALAREAAILVPEYEMKRAIVEAVRGQYDFSGCERILAFARAHDQQFRGHPLLWHKRNPAWLEDAVRRSRDERVIADYVGTVVRRFRGRARSWDVVNEALAPADGRPDNLRTSFWLETFGPHYIDIAYHAARAADPEVLLVYNDWGCELGAPANDRFRAATLEFLEHALARGVPIGGLGLQGHLRAFGTPVDQKKLATFLTQIKSLGLRILVTEHDVDDSGGPADIASRDRAVADTSRRFLDVVLDAAPVAVLTWGLSDRFLDPPGLMAAFDGSSPRMLPLDGNLAPTPMWHAMMGAFAAR
ncbi:MAG: endo-1,4-beta-xylanase [Rhizomicrobium sp.]